MKDIIASGSFQALAEAIRLNELAKARRDSLEAATVVPPN